MIVLEDFLKLRHTLPTVDVRSPLEFGEGHIPGAINIPILNNEERIAVGTDYKQKGQLEAIKTGFRLVGPRLESIINETEKVGKEIIVHCWRGGMRSSNFCQFVGMAGIKTHALNGGYKSYRKAVLQSFEKKFRFMVIGGATGSGKSELLRTLAAMGEQVIDLEDLANHRGSVFGGLMMNPQPTNEQFQNNLFEKILTLDVSKRIWIEDESIAIGKIFLPEPFWHVMLGSPLIELNVDKSIRVNRLSEEYGKANPEHFLKAMEGIIKKLGGQHYKAAREMYLSGDMKSTVDILLTYYDKAYRNGLEKRNYQRVEKIEWDGSEISAVADRFVSLDYKPVIR